MAHTTYQVIVRGKFAPFDGEQRAALLAKADEHDVFRAKFTEEGTVTDERSLLASTFRCVVPATEEDKEAVVVAPVAGDKYAGLVEGAWVLDRGRYRYLFMSGSDCCGSPDGYAVTVARRDLTTNGPWVRYAGGDHGAILRVNSTWQAPGHNAVIVDGAGNYWIMYHARRAGQSQRVLMIDRIAWVGDWPRVATDSPSPRPVAAPVP